MLLREILVQSQLAESWHSSEKVEAGSMEGPADSSFCAIPRYVPNRDLACAEQLRFRAGAVEALCVRRLAWTGQLQLSSWSCGSKPLHADVTRTPLTCLRDKMVPVLVRFGAPQAIKPDLLAKGHKTEVGKFCWHVKETGWGWKLDQRN